MNTPNPSEKERLLADLAKANLALEDDPTFQADVAGGEFIARVALAMDSQKISQSILAGVLGTTRQYVSRLLDEERQGNFTLQTLFSVSYAVGLKPTIGYGEIARQMASVISGIDRRVK
jgi:hypothetical protein